MRGDRQGWKSSCSCQSFRGNTCQKQHVDILLQALISITTRHRMILAIFLLQLFAAHSQSDHRSFRCGFAATAAGGGWRTDFR